MSFKPTLLDVVADATRGSRTAIIIPDGPTVTYSQLGQHIQHIAAALAAYLQPFARAQAALPAELAALRRLARDRGDMSAATSFLEESLRLHREVGDRDGIAFGRR